MKFLEKEGEVNREASNGFSVLMGKTEMLDENSFSVVHFLWQQKLFSQLLPLLLLSFQQSKEENKKAVFLFSISNILKHPKKEVLIPEIPSILPLLLQSLSTEDASLILSTLDTFLLILNESSSSLQPHLHSLVSSFLSLSKFPSQPKIRLFALKCLHLFTKDQPFHLLFPHRDHVVQQLLYSLDDKKRSVRKQAVQTRNEWITLQSD